MKCVPEEKNTHLFPHSFCTHLLSSSSLCPGPVLCGEDIIMGSPLRGQWKRYKQEQVIAVCCVLWLR